MPDREAGLRCYEAALREPTEARLDDLAEVLSPDVLVVGPIGAGRGAAAVREALANPQRPAMLAAATWAPPTLDGDRATVEVTLPAGAPIAGYVLHIAFDDARRITRVDQQMIPSAKPGVMPLALTEEIKQAVAGALANGTPIVLAYVDAVGAPHLSFRGSTQPFGDDRLAIWVRDAGGGFLAAIGSRPDVALLYRDPATRASYQFAGRVHVEDEPTLRAAVYEAAPEPERNLDARRLGVAVIVDLLRVEGMGPAGRVRMARGAQPV